MQISGYGAVAAYTSVSRPERAVAGESFQSEIRDRVTLSRSASASLLSASERRFFSNSFGMNVFAAEGSTASGSGVVTGRGASVLSGQEISFFENTLGYGKSGQYVPGAAVIGSGVNRTV